jgi:hypothetical protein
MAAVALLQMVCVPVMPNEGGVFTVAVTITRGLEQTSVPLKVITGIALAEVVYPPLVAPHIFIKSSYIPYVAVYDFGTKLTASLFE